MKLGKKFKIWKTILKFKKKNWKLEKSCNFGKILKIGKNLKFENNFEIWKNNWDLENKLEILGEKLGIYK